jgi:hypothetical protein
MKFPNLAKFILEVIKEEQLDEKLITYNNRKPYGQVVFLAGGAGSGKGWAIDNFIDSAGFKVRDVDAMKSNLQKLNRLKKLNLNNVLKRFGKNITPSDMEKIQLVKDKGVPFYKWDMRKPENVYALHTIVDAMGLKGKDNPEVLPNILFDITAKKVSSITEYMVELEEAGYKPENIHLTWVLTNYNIALKNNKGRSRVVPEDILLGTHEGAANTVWGLVTKAMPKGMNGRVDVILNNPEHTVFYYDKDGNKLTGATKGFLSLPVKKAGGSILPEKLWKDTLFGWIKGNAPESITANMK